MNEDKMKFSLKCETTDCEGEVVVKKKHKFIVEDIVSWPDILPEFKTFLDKIGFMVGDEVELKGVTHNPTNTTGLDVLRLDPKHNPLQLLDILKQVRTLYVAQNEYIDNIHSDLQNAISDNGYTNNQELIIDVLLQHTFGKHYEDVAWFLYQWRPGYNINVGYKKYTINTEQDYYDYFEKECLNG